MMQQDGFDKKREMVKMLMDMLKKSGADEVSGHPHMEDLSKTNDVQQKTSDSSMMSDGGMALASDEPENVMPSELPAAEGAEHPAPVMGEIEDEDEENNQSSFMGFMKKRNK